MWDSYGSLLKTWCYVLSAKTGLGVVITYDICDEILPGLFVDIGKESSMISI